MITANTIIINNIKIPAAEINRLLAEDRKLEAIAYIKNQTGMGLKEAKDVVENFERMNGMMSEGRTSSSQSARATSMNGKITVRYTDDSGRERIVTPADVDWAKVKGLMGDNKVIAEYEKTFQQNGNETMIDDALAQSGVMQQKSRLWTYTIITLIIILVFVYFILR